MSIPTVRVLNPSSDEENGYNVDDEGQNKDDDLSESEKFEADLDNPVNEKM